MGKTKKNPNRNTNDEKDTLSTKQSQATKKLSRKSMMQFKK